jgi:broad specificity phosphatase PhoE
MASDFPIIFVRHGETDWNKQGLIQGSINTDLNENGHAQAKAVGQLLACRQDEWAEFQIIVSPQKRAQQTLTHIHTALGRSDHAVDDRVRELGFGIWEGKPFWELKASPVYPADSESRYSWRRWSLPDGRCRGAWPARSGQSQNPARRLLQARQQPDRLV